MPNLYFLIIGIVVLLIGLILLLFRIILMLKCNFKVDATITKISKNKTMIRGSSIVKYNPVVTYEFNNEKFECNTPYLSKDKEYYKIGEKLPILINKNDPKIYRFPKIISPLIFGTIIALIGLTFVILYFL